jgi:hypothetical protein
MIDVKSAKWRPGFRNRVKAEVVLVEVEALREEKGIVKPADVVDRARRKRSPLHPQFEWDDSVAAERHREWQARQMLANLVVVSVVKGKVVQQAPVYVSVSSPEHGGERGYMLTTDVVVNEDLRLQALEDALKMLTALRRRYGSLRELVLLLEGFEDDLREAMTS